MPRIKNDPASCDLSISKPFDIKYFELTSIEVFVSFKNDETFFSSSRGVKLPLNFDKRSATKFKSLSSTLFSNSTSLLAKVPSSY